MQDDNFHALVVEDERTIRDLTIRALQSEGFSCDAAADGIQAVEKIAATRFDLIVTDLRMPNRHGYSLATELLALPNRPAIVILTGVLEPKLATDLISRGVEHVEFKPVRYKLFAAMVKAVVRRHSEGRSTGFTPGGLLPNVAANVYAANGVGTDGAGANGTGANGAGASGAGANGTGANGMGTNGTGPTDNTAAGETKPGVSAYAQEPVAVAADDIDAKLLYLSNILPISQAAIEVSTMANSDAFDAPQIAAAIARDPSLSVDVLRLANSSFYNPIGKKTIDLHESVVRVGQKRIGELALASSALAAFSKSMLPWMNLAVAWRRSIAAGIAVDLLISEGACAGMDEGLFLSAILHDVGRTALGMAYPKFYEEMVDACRQRNESLVALERRRFGMAHSVFMARMLEAWGIHSAIYEPLKYVTDDFGALSRLPEPLRSKAETIKLAIIIGEMAVGQWESWDHVEFPPATTFRRCAIKSFAETIERTRREVDAIVNFQSDAIPPRKNGASSSQQAATRVRWDYCNLSPEPFDFLAEIAPSMGVDLNACEPDALKGDGHLLVNSIWSVAHRLAAHAGSRFNPQLLIATNGDTHEPYSRFGRIVSIPASYAAIQASLRDITAHRKES